MRSHLMVHTGLKLPTQSFVFFSLCEVRVLCCKERESNGLGYTRKSAYGSMPGMFILFSGLRYITARKLKKIV